MTTDFNTRTDRHIWDYLLDKVRSEVVNKYNLPFNPIIENEAKCYLNDNQQYLVDTLSSEEFYTLMLFIQVTDDIEDKFLEY